jgi:hypothetical protein
MGDVPAWILLVVALAVVLGAIGALWVSWTAARLDRMHLRVEATEASLRAQLHRRASVAIELASSGLTDPASALVLLETAREARESEGRAAEHWLAESDLTAALHALDLPPPSEEPLTGDLLDAARKAAMARRIHNDLAATARALHDRRRVRWLRLAGHASPPIMIDFDDRADFAPGAGPGPAAGSDV